MSAYPAILVAVRVEHISPTEVTVLVFQRLGDNYFLSQVWTEGSSSGREFPKSKREVQLAKNNSKPELVIVAANISH